MAKLVVTDNVQPPLVRLVAGLGNVVAALMWPNLEVAIRHAFDGNHKPGSLHKLYAALDVRTHNFPSEDAKDAFFLALRAKFPSPRFDVIFEDRLTPNEHVHIEDNAAKPLVPEGQKA
jgi:hypothetical protein